MAQPPGFPDMTYLSYVCKFRKAIYGLKQAPRASYMELATFLLSFGFKRSIADASVYFSSSHISNIFNGLCG